MTASFTLVSGSFLFFVAMGWEHKSERFRNIVSVKLIMNLAGVEAGGGIKVLESRLRMKMATNAADENVRWEFRFREVRYQRWMLRLKFGQAQQA